MRRLIGLLLLCLPFLGCDSSNPVAPSGSVLTVTASPSQIGLDGAAVISVQGFRPDGNPLFPGTQVQMTTSMGSLSSSILEIEENGRGSVTLEGDGRTGVATVMAALAGSDAAATVEVQIGESDESRETLTLTASPGTIGLNESSTIRVLAREADGSPAPPGREISLSTSLGTLDSTRVVTDSAGEATTTLRAGSQPGTAEITATVGSSEPATVSVTIETRSPTLIISANPDTIPVVVGISTITVLARDNNGSPLGSGYRIQLLTNLGSLPEEIVTDSEGRAEATFTAGTVAGTATVQAVLGTSDVATATIDIRDAAADLSLTAIPSSINFGDATIELTAQVRNAQGEGVASINVTFVSDIGRFETVGGASSNGVVRTNTQGVADVVLKILQADIGGRDSFDVTASVVSEGQQISDTVTITID